MIARHLMMSTCLWLVATPVSMAGEFAWYVNGKSPAYSDQEINQFIQKGFENTAANLPSLDAKFKIGIVIGGGPSDGTSKAPAFIHMQKGKPAKEGGVIVKCNKYWFGNVTRDEFAQVLQNQATEMAKYVGAPDCN